jgi:hypothetical protein
LIVRLLRVYRKAQRESRPSNRTGLPFLQINDNRDVASARSHRMLTLGVNRGGRDKWSLPRKLESNETYSSLARILLSLQDLLEMIVSSSLS